MKIFIDAGHRNNHLDYGATGNGQKESFLALQISKKLKVELEKHKIICFLSRESEDDIISVSARPQRAHALKCDLLISVHINAAQNVTGNGIEVLYKHEKDLAEQVCNAMCKSTGSNNRGAKVRYDLGVLNGFKNSILVECGFISNYRDASLLREDTYQGKIAKAIADVVVAKYKIVVNDVDNDLANACNKLNAVGIKFDAQSWNNVSKMKMEFAQLLVERIGAYFKATNYFDSIDILVDKKCINTRQPWDEKNFKPEWVRQLIINASKIVG